MLAAIAKEVVPVISGAALAVVTLCFVVVQFELNRGDTQPIGEVGHRRVLRLATLLVFLSLFALVVVAAFSAPGALALIEGRKVRGRYVVGLSVVVALMLIGWLARSRRTSRQLRKVLALTGSKSVAVQASCDARLVSTHDGSSAGSSRTEQLRCFVIDPCAEVWRAIRS